MNDLVKDFLKQKSFAVVGSFKNESKYAYKILKNLKGKGYEVFPVNPSASEVEGITCYKTISDIPFNVDVANLITPPPATENIVKECLRKGIKRVWLQPGAESAETIKFCKENNIKVTYGICVMLEAPKEKETL